MENSDGTQIAEKAENQLKQIQAFGLENTKIYLESFRSDVQQLRTFIAQLSILSSSILAIGGAILGNKELVRNPTLLLIAMGALAIVVICSMFYLAINIETSIMKGKEEYERLSKLVRKQIDNLGFLIANPQKYEEFNRKNNDIRGDIKEGALEIKVARDKFLYFLICLLSLAILLIFSSFFQIQITR